MRRDKHTHKISTLQLQACNMQLLTLSIMRISNVFAVRGMATLKILTLKLFEATGGALTNHMFLPKTQKVCKHTADSNTPPCSIINSCLAAVICIYISIICCVGADTSDLVSKNTQRNLTKLLNMSSSDTAFRLSEDIKPLNYNIYLHPDLNNGTFEGRISILIDVLSKQQSITLHQKNLKISVKSLKYRNKETELEKEINESYPNDENEVFIVKPKEDLNIGLYELSLSFSGILKDKLVGFYSSKYKDGQNNTRVIATTKFEPTYARQAFPCFDEPNFKSVFSVKLVHPSGDGYHALSNMNIESTSVDQPALGLTTVTFAESVPMSTYLACFIVSDFVAVTKEAHGLDGRTFPVSVYTTKAQKDKGTFALDVGVKIIEYYIKLFNIDYPLPKLDMAAIPDFISGAMENWGLVVYRESRLFYDEKTSSTGNKQAIVKVIAHEFAHMWFGNLVTMKWWNDLWLNEGFAKYVEFKGSDAVFPEWNIMNYFLIDILHAALDFDAKLSSHPIVQTVSNPDEITAIFDIISYRKGASVLRMLENFLGTDVFFDGISKYLKKYKYQNAETVDLFNILQESVGKHININAIMDTWTRQMGYPVVNVKRDKLIYTLTQKRFLANSKNTFDPSESPFSYKWTIPVTYITSKNSTPTFIWFDKDAPNLVIKLDEPVDWIKFNVDQVGYYRVNYEPSEWQILLDILRKNYKELSTRDRTHILEEAFSLANAGELDYSIAMNMTLYLDNERNYTPWYVAASKLKAINTLLLSTETSDKLRDYARKLVNKVYDDVTWNVDHGKEIIDLHLRTAILSLACFARHVECLEQAGAIFKSWINDEKDERPPADIRSLVYRYGMMHAGGEAEWDIMFKRFVAETDPSEKNKLMGGLAGIRSSRILKKYINLAMDENYVRSQDTLSCLISISANPEGTQVVWDWVRENWQQLINRYTLNNRTFGRLVPSITKKFATHAQLEEIKRFFEQYPEAGAGASGRKRAIETVETNIKWLENNKDKIDRWLDSHSHLTFEN